MPRVGPSWPTWPLLLLLLLPALLQVGRQCQATADCMKNPFATVCRGISAKRSGVPSDQKRLTASHQQQMGQRANELADLLNKLNSLNQQQQQQSPPRPLAELLVRHWAAGAPNSAAKPMWPVALGDFLYFEHQPTDSVSSLAIGATGNE